MPTPKEQYIRAMNQAALEYGRLEDRTARTLLAYLRDLRLAVNDEMLSASGPGALQAAQFRSRIDDYIARFEAQAGAEVNSALASAYQIGQDIVIRPLLALGYRVDGIGGALLASVTAMSADLAQGITADALKVINLQTRMAALGQVNPLDAMREITRQFGIAGLSRGKMITQGVGYRAERILRTELNRTFNFAQHMQQQEASRQQPEALLKRWIATADSRTRHSHLVAHRRYAMNPIPVTEPFEVGGARMMYPLDPSAPPEETINCRCRSATIVPAIGVIGSSLDGRIAQVLAKAE